MAKVKYLRQRRCNAVIVWHWDILRKDAPARLIAADAALTVVAEPTGYTSAEIDPSVLNARIKVMILRIA